MTTPAPNTLPTGPFAKLVGQPRVRRYLSTVVETGQVNQHLTVKSTRT